MAVKLERIVKTFYDKLEEGKIMGRKCPECGAVEFPPVYACNTCGCMETEWYEISGKGVMHSIVLPAALSTKPEYADLTICIWRSRAGGRIQIQCSCSWNQQEKKKRTLRQASGACKSSNLSERRIQDRCL